MLGDMLRQKHAVHVGGNLGGSLLFDLPKIAPTDLVVLELSSYMLEHLRPREWSPHVAVVGMIGRDHLTWHGGEEAYVDAKKNLVRFQSASDFAILNEESSAARGFADQARSKVIRFDSKSSKPFDLPVAGEHNQLNCTGAFAAATLFGVTWDDAQRAMHAYTPLPHRLQLVHESNGVKWINDSIATIPEAAIVAMRRVPERNRHPNHRRRRQEARHAQPCARRLRENVKPLLTIGLLGPQLAAMIHVVSDRQAQLIECEMLERAANKARKIAKPGDVILLSTGCASYDQFHNFEERGEEFSSLATKLG